MKNEFTLTVIVHAKAETIYKAWLSTEGHSAITGSHAKVDGTVDGDFAAWDGYIQGMFLELEPNRRILQAWRTAEFPSEAEDSLVEILLEEEHGKTKLTLNHWNIPEGQAESYKTGWEDFYFKPMKVYFG
ncbi:MAG: SRPBCC domain-containing protein [Anaerolineales bacterium]|nr:SRPBCC domain-containing protein [Anaerolineales bacterium]